MDKQINRIDFFKSVEQNNEDYASIITSLFDQFSLLYNLVGKYEAVSVRNNSTYTKVEFDVTCSSEDQLKLIFNNILSKGNYTELYGRIFLVEAKQKDSTTFILRLTSKDPTITRI